MMYRVIFVLLLASTSLAANERQKYCTHIQNIARAAMIARQAGVPLQTMLGLVSDETAIGVVKAGYQYPRLNSAADQQASVDNFMDIVLAQCLKS